MISLVCSCHPRELDSMEWGKVQSASGSLFAISLLAAAFILCMNTSYASSYFPSYPSYSPYYALIPAGLGALFLIDVAVSSCCKHRNREISVSSFEDKKANKRRDAKVQKERFQDVKMAEEDNKRVEEAKKTRAPVQALSTFTPLSKKSTVINADAIKALKEKMIKEIKEEAMNCVEKWKEHPQRIISNKYFRILPLSKEKQASIIFKINFNEKKGFLFADSEVGYIAIAELAMAIKEALEKSKISVSYGYMHLQWLIILP